MKIMAHTVIGYPTLLESKAVVETYIDKGFEILELQIPFSHPTADGAVLTQANRVAAMEVSTQEAFDFLKEIRQDAPSQKMMVMTYLNKVFAFGIQAFCEQLRACEIPYLIIPDLPFDSPLAKQIHEHDFVQLVPVLSANVDAERLKVAMSQKPDYVYLMADFKITGTGFSLHKNLQNLVDDLKTLHPAKVGLGFGIKTADEVKAALNLADFAIMGSALTVAIDEGTLLEKVEDLRVGLS